MNDSGCIRLTQNIIAIKLEAELLSSSKAKLVVTQFRDPIPVPNEICCSNPIKSTSPKPRNRPSFRHILMHLDIAAVEILSTPKESYFAAQAGWKEEIRRYMQSIRQEGQPQGEQELIRRRREELRHAQDIRLHYERKLERTNNLYMEFTACLLQLEQREREIISFHVTSAYNMAYPLSKMHALFSDTEPSDMQCTSKGSGNWGRRQRLPTRADGDSKCDTSTVTHKKRG
ncbi:hypothetical protein HPB51_019849 [Rhipicephalus microplus]|uniref:Uncharacterized protein n=1 Tax=Rhipicephalus microplus TaxID=6941 RepID=A0A9J6DCF5_RHIMP|nr:hypothetical protein HPB51_019849 [Rhipicephalus microplus]